MHERGPKSSAIDFVVKSFDGLLEQLSGLTRLSDDRQGLEPGLKLELCRLTNRQQRFYLLRNPRIISVEFKFFLGL